MKLRHQATRQAIELIKRFEGFRRRAAMLQDGAWTIGYGHTRTARAGAAITEADADALLIYDVASVITAVNEWVYSPLTQNQFDALVAFAFNIGLTNFRRSSVLRRLNEGQHLQALQLHRRIAQIRPKIAGNRGVAWPSASGMKKTKNANRIRKQTIANPSFTV